MAGLQTDVLADHRQPDDGGCRWRCYSFRLEQGHELLVQGVSGFWVFTENHAKADDVELRWRA